MLKQPNNSPLGQLSCLQGISHSPHKVFGLRLQLSLLQLWSLTCLNGANKAYNKTSSVVQRQVEVDDITSPDTI